VANASNSGGSLPDKYGDVVQRLEEVVKKLEGGDLPLEESLRAFEEGIRLVRRGEQLLSDAEKRIEQLLVEGGEERVVPLPVTPSPGPQKPSISRPAGPAASVPEPEDDDIPF
jgi:exodeoxyribonuclease VII small subunit